jgi:hypothetical protein
MGNAILSRWPIAEEPATAMPSDGLPDGPALATDGVGGALPPGGGFGRTRGADGR